MTAPHRRGGTRWGNRLRQIGTKRYLGFVTCMVVVIGAAVTVVVAPRRSDGPVDPAPPSVRYVGVHEPDAPFSYYGVQQFAQAIGMQPNLVSYYSLWSEPFQTGFANSAAEHGAETIVQIDPTTALGAPVSLAGIADGKYDSYLRSYAASVKAFGRRIVLSFGHEMNGNWYSWGDQRTPPKVFVAAWRHIVNVFRALGVTNVIWLWTVNVLNTSNFTPIPDPSPWWPGRSYVSWVGIDGYYYNSSFAFASLFGPTIVAVRHLTSDPILIAETGAASSAGQLSKINDLFDGVRTYGLLGFIWFDENTQGHAWRINSPQVFAAFGHDAKAFLKPLSTPVSSAPEPSSGDSSLMVAAGLPRRL
jgi:mannan endo-1,4-beta-mannosidase